MSDVREEPAEPIREGNNHLNMFERIDRRCPVQSNRLSDRDRYLVKVMNI